MTQATNIGTHFDLEVNAKSFERHLAASNLSAMSRKTYLEAVRLLTVFLIEKGMPQRLGDMRREHVETFIADQLARWKPATAANRYGGLRAFFRWAVDEGEVKESPMAKMRPPKVPEVSVPVLSKADIEALFAACKGQNSEARRDMAIVRVMATCGLRRAEIAGLRYAPNNPLENDVDLDLGQLRVLGKGGRDRLVGIDPRTVKALDRYLRVRRVHPATASPFLWLGKKGRLTPDGIRQMLQRRATQADIGKIHPHMLRHSFAHFWLAAGGQETDLMRLAGWRSRQMVSRYASSAAQERALEASKRVGLGTEL